MLSIDIRVEVDIGLSAEAVDSLACELSARGPVGGAGADPFVGRPFGAGVGVAGAAGRGRSPGAGVAVGVGFADDVEAAGLAVLSGNFQCDSRFLKLAMYALPRIFRSSRSSLSTNFSMAISSAGPVPSFTDAIGNTGRISLSTTMVL